MEDDPEEHKHTYKKKTKRGNTKRFFSVSHKDVLLCICYVIVVNTPCKESKIQISATQAKYAGKLSAIEPWHLFVAL